MGKYFKIAFRNILRHKRRTTMLTLAIIIVISILMVLLAMSSGVEKTIIEGSTALLSGHVNIGGFFKYSQNSAAPIVAEYSEIENLILEDEDLSNYIDTVVTRVRGWGKLISDTGSIQAMISGVNVAVTTAEGTSGEGEWSEYAGLKDVLEYADPADYLEEGVMPSVVEPDFARLNEDNSVVLFQSHAKSLEVDVGDIITVSSPTFRNVNNTIDLEIVAVAKDIGLLSSFIVFTKAQALRDLYTINDDTTGVIQLYLKNFDDIDIVEDKVRNLLAKHDYDLMKPDGRAFFMKFEEVSNESWSGQKLDITTWDDEVSFVKWILSVIDSINFVITTILLIIIVIGLMNTLWMAIRERTKEIGTLRAIGMQRSSVLLLFLTEAFIISFFATLIGIFAGAGISFLLNLAEIEIGPAFSMFLLSHTLVLSSSFISAIKVLFLMTFLLTIGAFYPCYKATKMKPISAIHYIG